MGAARIPRRRTGRTEVTLRSGLSNGSTRANGSTGAPAPLTAGSPPSPVHERTSHGTGQARSPPDPPVSRPLPGPGGDPGPPAHRGHRPHRGGGGFGARGPDRLGTV